MSLLKVGDKAPDFCQTDGQNVQHSLSDYSGKWLAIFFYPKDNTPGCTTEACGFRDIYSDLNKKASLLGVSTDSISSHQKFADKFSLPFPLLSDIDKEMVAAYSVWQKKKFMGKEFMGIARTTYLIDPNGKIAKVYDKVKPETHPQQVLADLLELNQT